MGSPCFNFLVIGNRLLGDSLDTFPALLYLQSFFREYRKKNPKYFFNIDVSLCTYNYSATLYKNSFSFKETILINNEQDNLVRSKDNLFRYFFLKFTQGFRLFKIALKFRGKFDGVILFPGGFGWGLFARLLRVRWIVGHDHNQRGWLLTHKIAYSRAIPNYENFLNIVYVVVQIVSKYYFELRTPLPSSVVDVLHKKAIQSVEADIGNTLFSSSLSKLPRMFQSQGFKKNTSSTWVVIAPTASEVDKTWSKEYFFELASMLVYYGYEIIWVGLPSEYDYIEKLRTLEGKSIGRNFAGKLQLDELFKLIQIAHGFIGNDSGLAHAALMFGTLTVVMYGPGNPVLSRPFAGRISENKNTKKNRCAKLIAIYNDIGIPVEFRRTKKYRNILKINNITPQQVWDKIKDDFPKCDSDKANKVSKNKSAKK